MKGRDALMLAPVARIAHYQRLQYRTDRPKDAFVRWLFLCPHEAFHDHLPSGVRLQMCKTILHSACYFWTVPPEAILFTS